MISDQSRGGHDITVSVLVYSTAAGLAEGQKRMGENHMGV